MFRILAPIFLLAAAPVAAAQHHHDDQASPPAAVPAEPGQAAFSAISEIVRMLEADPATDWSKVSIDTLRTHLVDMDNVVMRARVGAERIPGGARFTVTGEGPVADSIRRMATAQASMINGLNGWKVSAQLLDNGVLVYVAGSAPADEARIRGLGYFGLLTLGSHHQPHHLLMAKGESHL